MDENTERVELNLFVLFSLHFLLLVFLQCPLTVSSLLFTFIRIYAYALLPGKAVQSEQWSKFYSRVTK